MRALAGLAAAALVVTATGCGGSSTSSSSRTPAAAPRSDGFAWLVPGPVPSGWRVATIPSGATMPYPSSWRRLHGDPGTATAALLDSEHRFLGYLNLTPRQGDETLADWSHFRVAHNAGEGDTGVTTLAAASGLRFRSGRGSCVQDSYTTKTGVHYVELACLVAGKRASTVIVGAAPPAQWYAVSPVIHQSISSFTT